MGEPLVSVIIPVYNMEAYLSRCLDSVLANTYQALEILCVDDGSKDSSLQILRQYAEKDARIVVISKENGGVSSARNVGLSRAAGEFVAFIDPDDFVHPQFFEFLVLAQQKGNSDLVICSFVIVKETDLPVNMTLWSFDDSELQDAEQTAVFKRHDLGGYCWGRLFRRSLLQSVFFREDISYAEDTIFNAEVWAGNPGLCAVILKKAMYYYLQREGSLISTNNLNERMKSVRFFIERACTTDNDPIYLDRAIKSCLDKRYLSTHILFDRDVSRECGRLLKVVKPRLRKTTIYTPKEKLVLRMFVAVPPAYWAYRSITQPYMWRWEKVQRRKRRAEKRIRKGNTEA